MSFDAYQQLELVRQIEQHKTPPWIEDIQQSATSIETELAKSDASFKAKAVARAQQLASLSGAASAYKKFALRGKRVVLLMCLIMAVVGFFAVLQTLASSTGEINVYWLLIIMLGLNLVSMLLWLAVSLRGARVKSPILSGYKKLLQVLAGRSKQVALFATWSEAHLVGATGKWMTSRHLHSAWLMYLFGGLVALVLTLSGKQYNFVWGTTILSPQTFVELTQTLGAGPAALGFSVPDQQAVLASMQGAGAETLALLRSTWASFIVGCILTYAVLPRLLLWLWSVAALTRAQKNYRPDWERPYFYALRSRLLPHSQSLGVVDSDQHPESAVVQTPLSSSASVVSLGSLELPQEAYSAAFEWGNIAVPPMPSSHAIELGAINDVHAQTGALQAIKQSPLPVVLIVDLQRAADRGAARFLGQLIDLTDLHLIVMRRTPHSNDAARWAGWQAAAERVGLPDKRLHLVSAE